MKMYPGSEHIGDGGTQGRGPESRFSVKITEVVGWVTSTRGVRSERAPALSSGHERAFEKGGEGWAGRAGQEAEPQLRAAMVKLPGLLWRLQPTGLGTHADLTLPSTARLPELPAREVLSFKATVK